ncbi:MAG: metalloregulator ArsR/SmtB family transcription factor [Nitriliruptorales bacterium]|nr:metalloregulator ArsR/SmtB family transcription factor [Nitriliruptorales bacterium]
MGTGQAVGAVFLALADTTRREVIARLSSAGPATATELAADLPITRQAVTKHLNALAGARLVAARREGREMRYRLTPEPLTVAMVWMASVGAEWDARLGRLAALLDDDDSAQ